LHFEQIKRKELYEGKLEQFQTVDDELNLANMRTALKLSQLLKD